MWSLAPRSRQMSEHAQQGPEALNRTLPRNHVIGAIDSISDANAAVEALERLGCPSKDILLVPSETFISDMEQIRRGTSRIIQTVHVFLNSTDDGFPADVYLEQARHGRHILHVYAPSAERAQEIADVLGPFRLHMLRYYGNLATIDFPSA
jgi:adenosine/AMP kinase